jgi:plasmid stabilization system protein ParE
MRVRFTEDAASDVQDIRVYLARDSAVVADRVVHHIGQVISGLRTFPRLGHPGVVDGTLERTVPRTPYVIVYRIDVRDDDQLIILRVYHAAQDRSRGEY